MANEVDIYNLIKYQRSNQNTCINQKPIVKPGERVKKGDVIGDGPATEMGELALGQNVVVAFMPWQGYNFEDSILLSERLVKEDIYTSIHIEEFECIARDTKLGKEEITRDIPNVGEEALKDLDESGIIRIGAEVKPGDILVGKITPKGETQLSPEEKLLRAIFGEKAGDVRDTSLRVPPGRLGHRHQRQGLLAQGRRQGRARQGHRGDGGGEAPQGPERRDPHHPGLGLREDPQAARRQGGLRPPRRRPGQPAPQEGRRPRPTSCSTPSRSATGARSRRRPRSQDKVRKVVQNFEEQRELIKLLFGEKIGRLKKGDELPPGVIKMVKVYVAIKRKLAVGDKMAGRHGNKGVVSRVLPEEDLPYLEDGTPVDIVLNPLGVPSRMNVGQILETHLGLGRAQRRQAHRGDDRAKFGPGAAPQGAEAGLRRRRRPHRADGGSSSTRSRTRTLPRLAEKFMRGVHVATPVFDGAHEDEMIGLLGGRRVHHAVGALRRPHRRAVRPATSRSASCTC